MKNLLFNSLELRLGTGLQGSLRFGVGPVLQREVKSAVGRVLQNVPQNIRPLKRFPARNGRPKNFRIRPGLNFLRGNAPDVKANQTHRRRDVVAVRLQIRCGFVEITLQIHLDPA